MRSSICEDVKMDMTVSNNFQPYKSQNKRDLGAKIGAGAGLAAGIVRAYRSRDAVKSINNEVIYSGVSKSIAKFSNFIGITVFLAITTGVGALVGKVIEKAVNHFKKSKSEQPKDPFAPRTVMTKDKEEYVINPGHPKTIYKKNPKTGELEYVTQVYDGSWGKEASDEDLIKVLTTKVK